VATASKELTVKVGFATEVDVDDSVSEELASSARATAAASATVAPIAKRIVLACGVGWVLGEWGRVDG
jgi:hypothetical protein